MLLSNKDYELIKEKILCKDISIISILLHFDKILKFNNGIVSAEIIYIKNRKEFETNKNKFKMILPIFDIDNFNKKTDYILDFFNKIDLKYLGVFLEKSIKDYLNEINIDYNYFIENKDEIIKNFYFILFTVAKIESSINKVLKTLINANFELPLKHQKKIDEYMENERIDIYIQNYIIDNNLKNITIDKKEILIETYVESKEYKKYIASKEHKEYIASKEYQDDYQLKKIIQRNNWIKAELSRHSLSSVYNLFFNQETLELMFDSKKSFESNRYKLYSELYSDQLEKIKIKFKEESINFFDTDKDAKKIYNKAINLYTKLERELILENMYKISFNNGILNDKDIDFFSQLYTSTKKFKQLEHNIKSIEIMQGSYLIDSIDDESKYLFKEEEKFYKLLLDKGINGSDWEKKAKEYGINIKFDILELIELVKENFEEIKNSFSLNTEDFNSTLSFIEFEKILQNNITQNINKINKLEKESTLTEADYQVFNQTLEYLDILQDTPIFTIEKILSEEEIFESFIVEMMKKIPSYYFSGGSVDMLMYDDVNEYEVVIEYFVDEFNKHLISENIYKVNAKTVSSYFKWTPKKIQYDVSSFILGEKEEYTTGVIEEWIVKKSFTKEIQTFLLSEYQDICELYDIINLKDFLNLCIYVYKEEENNNILCSFHDDDCFYYIETTIEYINDVDFTEEEDEDEDFIEMMNFIENNNNNKVLPCELDLDEEIPF